MRAVEGGRGLLADVPLRVAGLPELPLLYRVLTHLAFGAVVLLGRSECGVGGRGEVAAAHTDGQSTETIHSLLSGEAGASNQLN